MDGNLHVSSDVIIDASMPNVIRVGGQMWNKDNKLKNCQQKGQFDYNTTGHVFNIGLMAQKAEEYGNHNKTFEIVSEGTITVTNAAGNKIFEHAMPAGDIWSMCQVKDIPIQDWVQLAVSRAKATGAEALFWPDPTRVHDANLISLVKKYLANHDTTGCDIEFLKPDDACSLAREGLDTLNCTGNVLRDYKTDLFSIHKIDTVCKRFESEKMELEPEDALEQEDSIPQLDGAADPVSCNLCSATFEGKNKGIKLLSHKINEHFKDAFQREVKDDTRIYGFYHCKEENCSAKHKQKQDMFRHLATVHDYINKFSNMTRSISLLHPASNYPAPGTEKISDLNTQPGWSHQQEQVATTSSDGMSRSTAEINQGISTDGVFYINSFSDGCFLKLFFKTIRSNQCACLEKSMDKLKSAMMQGQVTFKSMQTTLKSVPPDLRIVCEDKIEFSSHKLLFGLMNATLASIFLEDEFINEIVTLFVPIESKHLEAMLNDEFVLKSKLKEIFSTSIHCPAGSRDGIKYLKESRSMELIKAEERHKFKEEEEEEEELELELFKAEGRHKFKEEEEEEKETDMGNVEEGEKMPDQVRISFKEQKRKKFDNTTQSSLAKHTKSKHEGARYVCDQCDYTTKYQSSLTLHIRVKHECVRYPCYLCDYQATQKHHLQTHIMSKHEGVKYTCDQCGMQFTLESNLNSHIKSKHEGVKHSCEHCGKQFTSRSCLTHHTRAKHDSVKYFCDQCDYQATQRGDLNNHIRNIHEGIKFSCEQCGKQFTQRTNLSAHIRLIHKKVNNKE